MVKLLYVYECCVLLQLPKQFPYLEKEHYWYTFQLEDTSIVNCNVEFHLLLRCME